ncbi:putative late blight resistance protein homolog R1B-16 [Salvia hispanica]|uniref:putative late blight resistance protein homolog R1B-16 n=1 Tax=Salvia hispanica TaxID=49212 RepID=UPI0020094318|nr:putative late blight resistance protein homolog R1B-16 [Salvia hispanica]
MAAYGALVSLMHIVENLEKHPSPPISIHKTQAQSLTQNINFLQEFLDGYTSPVVADGHEADPLERRIADAVYAAEDVIESQIVVQIDKRSTIVEDPGFYQDLQKVIEEMDLIKKEVEQIAAEDQKPVAALTTSSTVKENAMVGFEQVFLEVLDKLTGDQPNRQIIPIVGMGGIGKTTLARNLFQNPLVKEYFDIRTWTTISQTYNVRETLREVLFQASGDSSSDKSENKLGEKLYKFLYGRRYLVIMDDMWSVEVWERIKVFFPDNGNGSRIIVTTRLSNLSLQLNESNRVGMPFLDETNSWGLFCKIVFGKENCPLELENIGKNIVANCKGLPLSIATIGGLLAKSEGEREYWERLQQNLNAVVINSNDEFCLKILRMSYIYLPNYLKPCFLYMGLFEEDRRIHVSMLKKLWVSEGFLKPKSGKCLETIAQEYFKELVDRNLILVDELGSTGNIKSCKIHDLLRDLCLKEVEKERFYQVIRRDGPPRMNSERSAVFKTTRLLKSNVLVSNYEKTDNWILQDNLFEPVNLRFITIRVPHRTEFPSSIGLLWNLHTLIIKWALYPVVPIEIWKLYHLRHLVFPGILPNPPSSDNDIVILKNLQTLKNVRDLCLNEEVVKRIPNVKKLRLSYYDDLEEENFRIHCLRKLENLCFRTTFGHEECWGWISFPHTLKKLSVRVSNILELEDIMSEFGSLPHLEKFVLGGGYFKTEKWETIEGHFPSLKFLKFETSLRYWIVSDHSHFPRLEKLCLSSMLFLEEIPSEVGEIATLKSIVVSCCSESAAVSAKKIVEEQECLYGDQLDLHVLVKVVTYEAKLKSLANANFEVEVDAR